MFYVYVLKSEKNNRFYIGSTNNLERRVKEHNSGQSTYTRSTRPFRLIYQEEFSNLSEARKRERQLKGGQGREWLKDNFE